MNTLRIAMAQINPVVGDIAANTQLIIDAALSAKSNKSADLVVFPELTVVGYPPEDLLLRPGLIQRVDDALAHLSKRLVDIPVIVGAPRQSGSALYNAALLLRNGEIELEYYKQCLPNYGVFDEKRYFTPGLETQVFEINGRKLGITICEDIWFSAAARANRHAGAELIVNLNASPFHMTKLPERSAVFDARIKETGLPILYVNQVGGQDELVFDGGSMVITGDNQRLMQTRRFESALVAVDFCSDGHFTAVDSVLDDEQSTDVLVYQALVTGVRDYINKNRFDGAIVGVSGGIDSALTLAVAVDALGADRVTAVLMPSMHTRDISLADARTMIETFGVDTYTLPIETTVDAFRALLNETVQKETQRVDENIQARCRGTILMALSNELGRMVLTTGNKSEMAVGYTTLYGDMAGGFAPLKDVPKTLVYRLARYRNTQSCVIPERVITREPSAELSADQLDRDTLPDYAILDDILQRYIEDDASKEAIIQQGYEAETVEQVVQLIAKSEHKRRQAAPGVRVTRKAFGRDRRYPITSGHEYRHLPME